MIARAFEVHGWLSLVLATTFAVGVGVGRVVMVTRSAKRREKKKERLATLRAALLEVAALVDAPGSRTEREVDAIREVAQAAIHPWGELWPVE